MWFGLQQTCLFLLMLMNMCASETGITYHSPQNSKQYMYVEGGNVQVYCYGEPLEGIYLPSVTGVINSEEVYLVNCNPPITTFIEVLKGLNVRLETAKKLELHVNIIPIAAHLAGLNIQKLVINVMFSPKGTKRDILNLDFLSHLPNLTELDVRHVDLMPIQKLKVEKFKMAFGTSLGEFGYCSHLKELGLRRWDLESIPPKWLSNCTKLTSLRLNEMEKFSTSAMKNMIEGSTPLKELVITNSGLKQLPIQVLPYVPNLQKLDISHNELNPNVSLNLSDIQLKALSNLNISHSGISKLQGLPITEMATMEIDFRGNSIEDYQLLNADYDRLKNKDFTKILTDKVTMNCDCQHAWLALSVREHYLNLTNQIKCVDGDEIATVTSEVVECTRFACGNCTCRQQWSDNTTIAICNTTSTRIPHVSGLYALHAAGNLITNISPEDLPPSLLTLDVSRNRISNMPTETLEALFSVSDRSVMLSGNPLVCDCDTRALIEELQKHEIQVDDYYNITCFSEGRTRRISEVVPSELCFWQRQMIQTVTLAVCAAFVGILAITAALGFRYRQEIKVFLFARGWCLRFLHEEEIDSDRVYDAFVSFSHGDEEFVVENLLPILDNEYKLCLHFRDWVVGDFIPAQISRSVENSRRTVIVLSKKFVESVWGLLEFRTAHMNAVQEGRTRIILIVLDDVIGDENLDDELRNYIRSNTYVRWGDKWFWEKLRYAMPHTRTPPEVRIPLQPTLNNGPPAIMMSPEMELQIRTPRAIMDA